jgi:hypothetical protein
MYLLYDWVWSRLTRLWYYNKKCEYVFQLLYIYCLSNMFAFSFVIFCLPGEKYCKIVLGYFMIFSAANYFVWGSANSGVRQL